MQPANVDVYEKISGQIDTSHCGVGHAYLCQLQIAAIVVSRTADLKSGPIRGEGALVVLGAGGGRRADRRGSQCKRKCAEGRCHSEVCFREDVKLVLLFENTAGFTALYMLTVTCYGLGIGKLPNQEAMRPSKDFARLQLRICSLSILSRSVA
jgi:hypothetical protein